MSIISERHPGYPDDARMRAVFNTLEALIEQRIATLVGKT